MDEFDRLMKEVERLICQLKRTRLITVIFAALMFAGTVIQIIALLMGWKT